MNAESMRVFVLTLPHVVETATDTTTWGDKLVYRVGDQAIGGKMFSQIDFEEDGRAILSFAAGAEAFQELIERDGVIPAPYRARINWVALMRWDALGDSELKILLSRAAEMTFDKLPKKVQVMLGKGR
jgi:predicted DNA-binding protein (MmcQ/YjbR family)